MGDFFHECRNQQTQRNIMGYLEILWGSEKPLQNFKGIRYRESFWTNIVSQEDDFSIVLQ